jgi:hypothetical protein
VENVRELKKKGMVGEDEEPETNEEGIFMAPNKQKNTRKTRDE